MKLKRIIFEGVDGKIKDVQAVSIASDLNKIYEGELGAELPSEVQEQLDAQDAADTKELQIQGLYNLMVKEVYDEMESVFGTRNDISVSATVQTWQRMKQVPANYVGFQGLVDEAAVTAYADTQLAAADNYAKFRLGKIKDFQDAKAAILGS